MVCYVLLPQTKNWKCCFWSYVKNVARNSKKKKTQEVIKEELLNLLKESENEDQPGLDEIE